MEYEEDVAVSSSLLEEEGVVFVLEGVDWVVVLLGEDCWEEDLIPIDSSSLVLFTFSSEDIFLFNFFSSANVLASSSMADFPYFV